MSYPKTATVIVDFQYDFVEGSLAVPDALAAVEPTITAGNKSDLVAFTRDFHPSDHMSFSDNPQFVDKSWPPHCVQGTEGVLLHPELQRVFDSAPVFSKGTDPNYEQYSGAEAVSDDMTLIEWLDANDVSEVRVVGLATDYCVLHTVMDLLFEGFAVIVLADGIRGVAPVSTALAVAEMVDNGAAFTTSDRL